jgi:hypothetical protein
MINTYYKILIGISILFSGCNSESPGKWYKPPAETDWQWQLSGKINTEYTANVYDLDLFDVPSSVIKNLHETGRHIICYFSAGSYEPWRVDASDFPTEALGNKMDGWDELWLDIKNVELKKIMLARLDLAKSKGCDGVEPDNVDGYQNNTGFGLTAEDQKIYNLFLSREGHSRGLSIGLKNDLDQITLLAPSFDFAVNEQCHEYSECEKLKPFTEAGKPVFNAEYSAKYLNNKNARNRLCATAKKEHIRTLVLPLKLDDSFRYPCKKNKK